MLPFHWLEVCELLAVTPGVLLFIMESTDILCCGEKQQEKSKYCHFPALLEMASEVSKLRQVKMALGSAESIVSMVQWSLRSKGSSALILS